MPERPNILLIHSEQHRGDCLGVDGHPVLLTPNMDTIAYQGARFSRFYSACPSCIATRRCIMSGQLPQTHGLVGYEENVVWDGPTLPGVLGEHGYQSVHIGRSMHQFPPTKKYGFEEMQLGSEYREWLRTQNGRNGVNDWFGGGVMQNDWTAHPWHLPEDLHQTNFTVECALRFMKERDPTRPYFLSLGFIAAHPPLQPPAFYFDRYVRTGVPDPAIGNWAQPPRPEELGDDDYVSASRIHLSPEAQLSMQAGYYGLINHLDDQLRRLINPINGIAHRDNTIIIFCSDHGEMLGDHYLFRKTLAYEGSARVPFLISAPESFEIPKGRVIDTPATHADIMPTLFDMLDIPVPERADGTSLYPLLRGESSLKSRPFIHIEHAPNIDIGRSLKQHALTDGHEKYLWRPEDGREQLFDLQKDPRELDDLALKSDAADRLSVWRKRLIDRLKDRPEGFVREGKLVSGRPYFPVIPGTNEQT